MTTQGAICKGLVYVGHSITTKKVMVGINETSAILSRNEAMELYNHLRSTVRKLDRASRFDGGDDD
jgi:hypothetical protein